MGVASNQVRRGAASKWDQKKDQHPYSLAQDSKWLQGPG